MRKPLLASNLGYGSMGSGLTMVWDRSRNKNNDYLTVASITPNGHIEYYTSRVSDEQKRAIEHHANAIKLANLIKE